MKGAYFHYEPLPDESINEIVEKMHSLLKMNIDRTGFSLPVYTLAQGVELTTNIGTAEEIVRYWYDALSKRSKHAFDRQSFMARWWEAYLATLASPYGSFARESANTAMKHFDEKIKELEAQNENQQ